MTEDILQLIKDVLDIEAASIQYVNSHVDVSYEKAVSMLLNCNGKVVLIGIGKSGHIARKISATLSSTGTTSVFMHPSEGAHGDLGTISQNDVIIAISKSGESNEINYILPVIRKIGVPIISITANHSSTLGKNSDIVLFGGVEREACPHDLAPTTSTTVALAIGDALAITVMKIRGFQPDDFAFYHPAGALGRRLLLQVKDVMIPVSNCAVLTDMNVSIKDILIALSRYSYGIVLFLDENAHLHGIVTDGDIRRLLEKYGDTFMQKRVEDVLTTHPVTVDTGLLAFECLKIMESRDRPLNVLPVMQDGRCCGIVRTHELIKLV